METKEGKEAELGSIPDGKGESKVNETAKGKDKTFAAENQGEEGNDDESEADLSEQVFTYEGLFNTKKARLENLKIDQAPDSYVENCRKEELCLEFVDNFVRQFKALFPERKDLFVTPKNEFNVEKFICTTVRPTQLPFKSLYNVGTAAEFFSHFMQYEPLEDPTSPPEFLPSPSFTLESQIGDCFDLSTLLCSYLVGSGYDAYCVYGYAPKGITLLNRTGEVCPLELTPEVENIQTENEDSEELKIVDLRMFKKEPKEPVKSATDILNTPLEDFDTKEDSQEDGSNVAGNEEEGAASGETKTDGAAGGEEGEAKEQDGENPQGAEGSESKSGEGTAAAADAATDPEGKEEDLESEEVAEHDELAGGEQAEEENEDPYAVEFMGIKPSKYVTTMKEREEQQASGHGEEHFEEEESLEEEEEEEEEPDHLEGKRVHCWILVRAGKRMVDQSFFVEPSTGKLYHINGSPYLGIEAVWNNKNYWVNMQQDSEDAMNISYNLDMDEYWEYIFVKEGGNVDKETKDNGDTEPQLDQTPGGVAPDAEEEGEQEEKAEKEMILDLPPSWVQKLVLSRDAYRRKYNTSGQRTQLFLKSKLESYAEHLHIHGLVKRLVLFSDRERTLPVQVREYFANRRDKLTLRVRHPLEGRIVEHFAEGRASGLKIIDEVTGSNRNVLFYAGARLDGLCRRYEDIGEQIVEYFEGRDDHLEKRIVILKRLASSGSGVDSSNSAARRGEEKSGDSLLAKTTMTLPRAHCGGDVAILKMKQFYSRNKEKDADSDISKRSFQLTDGAISIIYHYAKGKISRSSRRFYKDTSIQPEIKLSGSFAKPLRPSQIEEEFQTHLQAEKDCYQSIRDAERESQDILALRKREESNIVLEKSIFDTARDKAKMDTIKQSENQVEEEKDPRHVDYLTPFLSHIPNLKKMKREEAEQARDMCLKSLKDRLLERANIIQCRLDEENAKLAKKQAAFQRSRDHVDGADQEFEVFCSQCMFRIQILEQRLARHEESALSVYANLDQKLRNDPRLGVLYKN